jgi:hypothetical protein
MVQGRKEEREFQAAASEKDKENRALSRCQFPALDLSRCLDFGRSAIEAEGE